jgi:hypothetical protein
MSWRNPSPLMQMAIVAGVFAALGVLGGLYIDLLLRVPLEPTLASLLGCMAMAPLGIWFESDPRPVNPDDPAGGESADSAPQFRI